MIIFLLVPIILLFVIISFINRPKPKSLKNRHVVVIGGSSGIGKSIAFETAKRGAHVTIIARNVEKLDEALEEVKRCAIDKNQTFNHVSVDVTNFEDTENNLCEIEETVGPIYMLVNCAGMAICGELENIAVNDIKSLVNVNLLGSIYPIKAILPRFKQRKEGIIVVTASLVALMGMYGYSVYSSCKFAIRGLAESVHMEVKPYGITVTLALPPDTDTPGFENENKTKPKETSLISEAGKLFHPDEVAKKLVEDALTGKFFSHIGMESFILTTLCMGMSPFNSFLQVIIQSWLLGALRLIGALYSIYFDRIVKTCFEEKTKKMK